MKRVLLSQLRDRNATLATFRQAADQLATVLAVEASSRLSKREIAVKTPLANTQGLCFCDPLVLVPILRSGFAMLPSFLRFFPDALVGFIGVRRNEETAEAHLYYSNLPSLSNDQSIFILEPMIATGGSSVLAVNLLKEAGALESQITLITFLGAPEGIQFFKEQCPQADLVVAQIDEGLNDHKWILPGLGDFGDRYFGTQ